MDSYKMENMNNPFRGMDLQNRIVSRIRRSNFRGNGTKKSWPIYIQIGISHRKGVYNGRLLQREFELILYGFKALGYPLKNVIGVDINSEVISSWKNCGATLMKGDWNDPSLFKELNKISLGLTPINKSRWIETYVNTTGGRYSLEVLKLIQDFITPHTIYNYYAFRTAFTSKSIIDSTKKALDKYEFQNNGLLKYSNGALGCLKRIPNERTKYCRRSWLK